MYINIGRGCFYRCGFCALGRSSPRIKSAKKIIGEIKFLKNRYGFKKFFLEISNFLFDKKIAEEICKLLIKEKLNISWRVFCRIESLDKDLLRIMSRAGCQGVFCGIESGSLSVQKTIGKIINFSLIRSVVSQCKEVNITPQLAFIVGFPNEKEEDLNATIKLALDLLQISGYQLIVNHLTPWAGVPLLRNKNRIIFNRNAARYDTNGCYLQPTVRLKENYDLARRFPALFNYFYVIESKHLSAQATYELGSMFCNLAHNYPLSFQLALKELSISPVELKDCLNLWLRREGIVWGDSFANFRQESRYNGEINKFFPVFIRYLYRKRKAAFEFLKPILCLEEKKFIFYYNLVNSKNFLKRI